MSNLILIIGNGFDLKCNLKSRFSDFITPQKLEAWYSDVNICPNFWYLLFALKFRRKQFGENGVSLFKNIDKDEYLWMDIEGFIKEICVNSVPKYYNGITLTNKYLPLFQRLYSERNNDAYRYTDSDLCKIKKYFKKAFPGFFEPSEINIIEYLLGELRKFENEFSIHLTETVEKTDKYFEEAKKLFRQLGCFSHSYLIDFNYTHDSENFDDILLMPTNFIHGSIKKGTIVGFDSSNVVDNSPIVFSKAWRKMSANYDIPMLPEFDEKLEIKFFGHSLGEQDYSYFHALFDKYDIYNNNVKLTFVYEKYGKTQEENDKITKDQFDSVYRLLNDYASRSGKENEYRTIVSRLHIENRLHIYSFEDYLKTQDIGLNHIAIKNKEK